MNNEEVFILVNQYTDCSSVELCNQCLSQFKLFLVRVSSKWILQINILNIYQTKCSPAFGGIIIYYY